MARHFISVLGTGPYKRVKYYASKDFEHAHTGDSAFIQEALLLMNFGENEDVLPQFGAYDSDRISVFLTHKTEKIIIRNNEEAPVLNALGEIVFDENKEDAGAYEMNWIDREYTRREEKDDSKRREIKEGLESKLNKIKGHGSVTGVPIEIAKDMEGTWKLFNDMLEEINDGDELYVDVTHAFRSIPMIMLAVVAFARVTKNVHVKGIYYGAFEAGGEESGEAPVFDMRGFLDVIDWAHAANSFIKYGVGDEIDDIFECDSGPKKLTSALKDITRSLETSKGYMDANNQKRFADGKSIRKACIDYKKEYARYTESCDENIVDEQTALKQLLPEINGSIGEFYEGGSLDSGAAKGNLGIGIAAVDWAIKKHMVQQGFTALEETIKTYVCVKCGFDEKQSSQRLVREDVCNSALTAFARDDCFYDYKRNSEGKIIWLSGKKAIKSKRENIETKVRESFFDAYWLNDKSSRNKKVADEKKKYSKQAKLAFDNVSLELVILATRVKACRHNLNHFGYDEKTVDGCIEDGWINDVDIVPDSADYVSLTSDEDKLTYLFNIFRKIAQDTAVWSGGVNDVTQTSKPHRDSSVNSMSSALEKAGLTIAKKEDK